MRLVTDNNELTKIFMELIGKYSQFSCCVAWAGDPNVFKAGNVLKNNGDKICKVAVGLHFYQTHPNFIESFLQNEGVRFYMQTDGVFHDKIYLFSNSAMEWSAIIGSSNFTNGGFNLNSECNVLISNEDDLAGTFYNELDCRINEIWNDADEFSKDMLEEYRACYILQQGKRDSLKKIVSTRRREFDSSELALMPWDEYCALIRKTGRAGICINRLRRIQSIFKRHPHYHDMSLEERINVAGFVTSTEDFAVFGTTKRNHLFGEFIKANNEDLSRSLDHIPLKREVKKDNFNKYLKFFKKKWSDPLATATRLIAMKRPDVFVCVNGANKQQLAKYLNMPPSRITIESYWDTIIEPVRQSVWYNSLPSTNEGMEYSPYRVALLDALIYEP